MFLFCFVLFESSGGAAETPNAFIFSLNNFEGLAPFVSMVKTGNTKTAIYRSSDNGPMFGQDLLAGSHLVHAIRYSSDVILHFHHLMCFNAVLFTLKCTEKTVNFSGLQ